MPLPNILQPRWKLFLRHHERLRDHPEPGLAEQRFAARIQRSKRVGLVRTGFFVGLYFSFVTTAVSLLVDYLNLADFGLLKVLQTIASSLTVVFIAGIFVCNRYLGYLEVDMHFFSAETRLK